MGAKSGRFLADDLASGSVRSQLHGLKDAQEVFWHQNGTEQSFPLCFEYPNSGSLQCWSFVLLLGLSIFFSSQTRRYNNDIHYSKSTLDNVPIPTLCSPQFECIFEIKVPNLELHVAGAVLSWDNQSRPEIPPFLPSHFLTSTPIFNSKLTIVLLHLLPLSTPRSFTLQCRSKFRFLYTQQNATSVANELWILDWIVFAIQQTIDLRLSYFQITKHTQYLAVSSAWACQRLLSYRQKLPPLAIQPYAEELA